MSEEQIELGPMVSLQMSLLGLLAGTDPRRVGMIGLYQELLEWTDEIAEQIDEYDASFKLYDKAVRRGTKEWQAAPENLSTIWPDTAKLVAWMADEIDTLRKQGGVVKAAGEWDRAHPNPDGHCDNDDLRMCVTASALKKALREV